MPLKLHCAKRNPTVNHVLKQHWLIWAVRHLGNVLWSDESVSFLQEMDAVCSRPEMKRTVQTVTIKSPKASFFHGMVCQCPWKRSCMQMLPSRWHLFQGHSFFNKTAQKQILLPLKGAACVENFNTKNVTMYQDVFVWKIGPKTTSSLGIL